jgi:hypothetical protein
MKIFHIVIIFCFLGLASNVYAEETPHLQFVSEYIRQLGAIENIRAVAESDTKKKGSNQFADCIHNTTKFQLELKRQIATLVPMHLNPPFEDVIQFLTASYDRKLNLYKELSDICSTMAVGPNPNVDYDKITVRMPKITAELEYIDEGLIELSAMVFATLINPKPDAQNHVNHLIITNAEREQLKRSLKIQFGDKLEQNNQSNIASAAKVLHSYLLKDYKCSDDPW